MQEMAQIQDLIADLCEGRDLPTSSLFDMSVHAFRALLGGQTTYATEAAAAAAAAGDAPLWDDKYLPVLSVGRREPLGEEVLQHLVEFKEWALTAVALSTPMSCELPNGHTPLHCVSAPSPRRRREIGRCTCTRSAPGLDAMAKCLICRRCLRYGRLSHRVAGRALRLGHRRAWNAVQQLFLGGRWRQ